MILKKYSKNTIIYFLAIVLITAGVFGFRPFKSRAEGTSLSVIVAKAKEQQRFYTATSSVASIVTPGLVKLDFHFPPNFLNSGEQVEMVVWARDKDSVTADKPIPSGKLSSDTVYDITFTKVSDFSAVTSFDKPTTLTFNYTDADISGIDEATLVPYRWDGSEWSLLSGGVLDMAANTVTVASANFSFFTLIGEDLSGGEAMEGGGGGAVFGGGFVPQPTVVIFNGLAYPNSRVNLLKNAQIVATDTAGADGKFEMRLSSGISAGAYSFGIWAQDSGGILSAIQTFNLSVNSNVMTIVNGIFLPPTILLDKVEAGPGDILNISGQSAPLSDIEIFLDSKFIRKISANNLGIWFYQLGTADLDYGEYEIKVRAIKNKSISDFSKLIHFNVVTKELSVLKTITATLKGDWNNDNRINLIDFSIAAYWYKRPSPSARIDLNRDGKIDLIDFSIMAFYWTG